VNVNRKLLQKREKQANKDDLLVNKFDFVNKSHISDVYEVNLWTPLSHLLCSCAQTT